MTEFETIEKAAAEYIEQGYEPVDSEPGEWLTMAHPDGRVVTINAEGEIEA